jgi:hypothetical protein
VTRAFTYATRIPELPLARDPKGRQTDNAVLIVSDDGPPCKHMRDRALAILPLNTPEAILGKVAEALGVEELNMEHLA